MVELARDSGIRGRDAGKARAHDHQGEQGGINEAVSANQKTERSGMGNTIPFQVLRKNVSNSVELRRWTRSKRGPHWTTSLLF